MKVIDPKKCNKMSEPLTFEQVKTARDGVYKPIWTGKRESEQKWRVIILSSPNGSNKVVLYYYGIGADYMLNSTDETDNLDRYEYIETDEKIIFGISS